MTLYDLTLDYFFLILHLVFLSLDNLTEPCLTHNIYNNTKTNLTIEQSSGDMSGNIYSASPHS